MNRENPKLCARIAVRLVDGITASCIHFFHRWSMLLPLYPDKWTHLPTTCFSYTLTVYLYSLSIRKWAEHMTSIYWRWRMLVSSGWVVPAFTLLWCHHCCCQGTNSEQDARFYNKQKKLLKTMKFPSNIGTKVPQKLVYTNPLCINNCHIYRWIWVRWI